MKDRAEQPVEDTDDLAPITVKPGEVDEDGDDDAGDDQGGGERSASAAAPARGGQAGDRPGAEGGRNRPSKGGRPGAFRETTAKLTQHEQTIGELRQEIARMNGRYEALTAQRQDQKGAASADPTATEITRINTEMARLVKQSLLPDLDEGARSELAVQYQQLQERKEDLRLDARLSKMKEEMNAEADGRRESPELFAARTMIATEFPALNARDDAKAAAGGYYHFLVATKGNGRESMDLMREACAYTTMQMGLGPRPGRSQTERAAHSSVPGGTAPGGTGEEEDFTFQPQHLQMMRGSGVSPAQVHKAMQGMRREG